MKKFLISLLLGVSMVTMAGCGNANKEVADTNVEQNEREGAYPNFQDKEVEEPIGLSKEDKEEKAIEEANNKLAYINSNFNAEETDVEVITICYIDNGIIHVYDSMDYSKSNKHTNAEVVTSAILNYDEEWLNTTLGICEHLIDYIKPSFEANGLDIGDYEIRYHECIGNPISKDFLCELSVIDEDGNVVKLLKEELENN